MQTLQREIVDEMTKQVKTINERMVASVRIPDDFAKQVEVWNERYVMLMKSERTFQRVSSSKSW